MATVVATKIENTAMEQGKNNNNNVKTKSVEFREETNSPKSFINGDTPSSMPPSQPIISPNDQTKTNSSLLDLDYTPQKNKHQSSQSQESSNNNRKSSLSTESVEVYIYRRTSLVTSSGIYSVFVSIWNFYKLIN